MKGLLIIVVMLSLTSCGKWNKVKSHYTGDGYEVCHKGVTYLQFSSGAVLAVNRDGKPLLCN